MIEKLSITQILFSLLLALIMFVFSSTLHEIAHIIMCKLYGLKIIGLKLMLFNYDGKKWKFKPFEKNHCAFISDNNNKTKVVMAFGPIIEILFIIVCCFVSCKISNYTIKLGIYLGVVLISISLIIDLLPISKGDGRIIFEKR